MVKNIALNLKMKQLPRLPKREYAMVGCQGGLSREWATEFWKVVSLQQCKSDSDYVYCPVVRNDFLERFMTACHNN